MKCKVLSLISVFLLLFALGGVASADPAADVDVKISYPCEDGVCDTGVAQSSLDDVECGDPGDTVNVYVTLLDAAGNPATEGPNGEDLATLRASLTSGIAAITPNTFLQQTVSINFDGDAAGRAYLTYTNADTGTSAAAVQDAVNVILTGANPLGGTALVNVQAEDAESLAVRTCGGDAPSALYEAIEAPCNNDGAVETAGSDVTVTVIADQGCGNFTTAPNLQGQQVTVSAYADLDGSLTVGDDPAEEAPIATATGTIQNGIAEVAIAITNAGPNGLLVEFRATAEDTNGETIDGTEDVDTVIMEPDAPTALMIAEDTLGAGNLIEPVEDDCIFVLDDNNCGGAGTDVTVVLVDQYMNAVIPEAAVNVTGSISGIVGDQLSGCETNQIASPAYSFTCNLVDTDVTDAGPGASSSLIFADTNLTGDQIQVRMLPATACNTLDLQVSTDAAEPIPAGSDVEVTVGSTGLLDVVIEGDDLAVTAGGAFLSSDGCDTQTTNLSIPAVQDADSETDGIQFTIQVCSPATDAIEPVCLTVTNLSQCGAAAETLECIPDVVPGDPTNLAVVGLGVDGVVGPMESESELDSPGDYVGTNPIVIDSYIVADGATRTTILDDSDGCCDLQVWDAFTNVNECSPTITCVTDSGNALPVNIVGCSVSVAFTSGAVGSTVTVTCGVDTDDDGENDVTRDIQLVNIVSVIPEDGEEPEGLATALELTKEGPQDVDGNQVNPAPGGEAIIQIGADGTFAGQKNVTLNFASGSVEGAELRNLDGSSAGTLPLTVRITSGAVQRYVVTAPAAGEVIVTAIDNAQTDPLTGAELSIFFGGAGPCEPVVTVTCNPTSLCPDGADVCSTCTAATGCNGDTIEGTYSWELNGAVTTANTGNSIEICQDVLEDGSNTITATDTTNGDIQASATISFNGPECEEEPVCQIDVLRDSLPKSHWVAIPVAFRIETIGIDPLNAFTTVNIVCDADGEGLLTKSILKTGKVVLPNFGTNTKVILQTGLIWPAWWTQSFDLESETCTVTVGDCVATDTFELNYLSLGAIPLDQ